MKRTIFLILVAVSILFILSSCDPVPPSPSPSISPSSSNMWTDGGTPLPNYGAGRFSSVEELYQFLSDMSEENLKYIQEKESKYNDREGIIYISEAEHEYGIYGNLRKTLLERETVMFPYLQNEPLPLDEEHTSERITLYESGIYGKPGIQFLGTIEDTLVAICITYYDPALIDEANEKGASWLLSVLDSDGYNIYNYQEHNEAMIEQYTGIWTEEGIAMQRNTTAYEKECRLGDRNVNAMVIGWDGLRLQAYFVYDNILVYIQGGVEAVLPHLTFREIHMPTGEPLRDTPEAE